MFHVVWKMIKMCYLSPHNEACFNKNIMSLLKLPKKVFSDWIFMFTLTMQEKEIPMYLTGRRELTGSRIYVVVGDLL